MSIHPTWNTSRPWSLSRTGPIFLAWKWLEALLLFQGRFIYLGGEVGAAAAGALYQPSAPLPPHSAQFLPQPDRPRGRVQWVPAGAETGAPLDRHHGMHGLLCPQPQGGHYLLTRYLFKKKEPYKIRWEWQFACMDFCVRYYLLTIYLYSLFIFKIKNKKVWISICWYIAKKFKYIIFIMRILEKMNFSNIISQYILVGEHCIFMSCFRLWKAVSVSISCFKAQ